MHFMVKNAQKGEICVIRGSKTAANAKEKPAVRGAPATPRFLSLVQGHQNPAGR